MIFSNVETIFYLKIFAGPTTSSVFQLWSLGISCVIATCSMTFLDKIVIGNEPRKRTLSYRRLVLVFVLEFEEYRFKVTIQNILTGLELVWDGILEPPEPVTVVSHPSWWIWKKKEKKERNETSRERIKSLDESFYFLYRTQGVVKLLKSNQGNQGYSGNQKNAFQGQRPDMENRHTQQRT